MPKRKNFICMLRKPNKYPNGYIARRDDDRITIFYNREESVCGGQFIVCTQADARLIAKRINRFLDNGG
jgi:hypothetical protein